MEKEHLENRAPITERIAVCISSNPIAQYLIARTARMAERIGAEFFVIYVDIGKDDPPEHKRTLQENIRFAENLGAQVVKTTGKKVAAEVAKIVKVTGWRKFLYLSAIHDFLREAPKVDVHIVTQEPK
jgi:two-component system sensor histidine kinase KdpD